MKKRRAAIFIGIFLIVTGGGLATTIIDMRTVDFLKVLALGIGIGALLSQLFNSKT